MATPAQTGIPPAQPPHGGVTTLHPAYVAMQPLWQRCRDVAAGEDAVHDRGETYLPRLHEQPAVEYAAMVMRTPLYNATWRTIAGLNGMMFRRDPQVAIPDSVVPMLEDITLTGVPFTVFAQNVGLECLTVGRVGVLVDFPSVTASGRTQADVRAFNLRPFMCSYRAESIINWRTTRVANRQMLSLVVLAEKHSEPVDDFSDAVVQQWRVLELDDKGKYRQRLFQANSKGIVTQTSGDVYPTLPGGVQLDFIPFVFMGVDDVSEEMDIPPLVDLVNMNLAHYRVSCDYEIGCHRAGIPTPYVVGWTSPEPGQKLYAGGPAWIFPDASTRVGYLEFSGAGLGEIAKNLDRKEQQMAILGARMLEVPRRMVEAAQTAQIYRKGEESVLGSIAGTLSEGLTRAMRWLSAWGGGLGDVSVEINREFEASPLSGPDLAALVAAWQGNAMPFEVLWGNLQRGDIAPPDMTAEDAQAKMQNEAPLLLSPFDTGATTAGSTSATTTPAAAGGT